MAKTLSKYTLKQQRNLKLAPFAVFDAVAGADGVIETRERQDFINYIKNYNSKDHALTQAIMDAINSEPTELMKMLSESTQAHNNIYHLWSTLEKEWENPEIKDFREDLFNLGVMLTGDFPTMGSSETMALAGLAILLETDIEDHPSKEDRLSDVHSLLMEIEMEYRTS